MKHLLLVSQEVSDNFSHERNPLDRMVIPLRIVTESDYLPEEHVWWVERRGQAFYLRAKLYVTEAFLERKLKLGSPHLIWHLDPIHSERITWSGSRYRKGNLTDFMSSLVDNKQSSLMLVPIPSELDQELEYRRISISEVAWTFESATRVVCRLFDQAKTHLLTTSSTFSIEEAWHFVHAHFAREELVSVSGFDVYEVAAAVLAGYTALPDKLDMPIEDVHIRMTPEFTGFRELDEEHLAYVENQWTKNTVKATNPEVLGFHTKRHQQILEILARQLREQGFLPTYNRYVDLRIEYQNDEVFFEVKTSDASSFLDQVRCAVGQLLEYGYRYKRRNGDRLIRLVLVIEASVPEARCRFAQGFLADIGIALVLWEPDTESFNGLAMVLS